MSDGKRLKSIHFARCIGVFEGGGIRGAAHAGAFSASDASGINFEATIGSSAGSMIAVLIAAGLTPNQVIEELSFDLSSLLVPTKPVGLLAAGAVRMSSILGTTAQSILRANYALGLYSSAPLRAWMNRTLRKYLPKSNDPVIFKDLHKPVAVMATDLVGRKPKVWSSGSDPATPVGYAVEASCAIPFFFQPVGGEATMLVDGGVLSNLPLFLVPHLKLSTELPILCFRLNSTLRFPPTPPQDGIEMIRALIDTATSGATEVQLSMGPSRQVIEIFTGEIGTTDFRITQEQVKSLIKAGETAVQKFVSEEQLLVTGASTHESPIRTGYRRDVLERTAQLILGSAGPVYIMAGDMSWLKELHIALLLVGRQGREVRILYDAADSPEVRGAVTAAMAAGAKVVEARAPLALRATIVNPRSDSAEMIAVEKIEEPFGRVLSAPTDRGLLTLAVGAFDAAWEVGTSKGGGAVAIIDPIPVSELLEALNAGVPQYRGLRMSIERVNTEELLPLSWYLDSFKLARVADLDRILSDEGLENAARIKGSPWPITPPIVERLQNGRMVIIDGTHRVYHALQNGQQQMRVILVENTVRGLPAEPLDSWSGVRVMRRKLDPTERYRGYNQNEFRHIREAFSVLGKIAAIEGSPAKSPAMIDASIPSNSVEDNVVLEHPRTPFLGQQRADFFLKELSPGCRGFRLRLGVPRDSYWRAGFALAPNDYIREGRSDIDITQYFLFHIGRGNGSRLTENTELHYRAYYNRAPLTQWIPFGSSFSEDVSLHVELGDGNCRVTSNFDGRGFIYSTVVDPNYVRWLYVLAWADGFAPFRVPITLNAC